MAEKLRFSEASIRRLPIPIGKPVVYKDYDPPEAKTRVSEAGLEVVVYASGIKSFVLRRKFKGKAKAITIGRHSSVNVETARELARDHKQNMAKGVDPTLLLKAEKAQGVTLEQCFNDYLKDRKLAVNTVSNYQTILDTHLKSWKRKPMADITRDRIAQKHKALSELSFTSANKSMRVLRALFNYAYGAYEDGQGKGLFPDNPVDRLSHTRSWNRETRRSNTIKVSELKAWFKAVKELDGEGLTDTVRDLLMLTLLTGLRRREASNLRWDSISFEDRSFIVTETKNKVDLSLPIPEYLYAVLKQRREKVEGEYVFPGGVEGKPIQEPKKQIVKIQEASGVVFSIHDMRRTFITMAESLDISAFAIKALVNHKQNDSDVTGGYIRMDVERLRKPMQQIESYILGCAGVTNSKSVVSLKSSKARMTPS